MEVNLNRYLVYSYPEVIFRYNIVYWRVPFHQCDKRRNSTYYNELEDYYLLFLFMGFAETIEEWIWLVNAIAK